MTESAAQRFRDLYVSHYGAVLGYCLRRLGSDEASDAAAETFVVAWRRLDAVPSGEHALPWLYRVAANTVANQRRSQRRLTSLQAKLGSLGAVAVSPQPDVQVVRRHEDQQIVDAINRLRPPDREVLLLSAWEGLPASLVAKRFGITVGAAEQRLTRAKRRLASELKRANGRAPLPIQDPGDTAR